jgi:hypothetical protein
MELYMLKRSLSFILTFGLGLAPPLLIRFAVNKKPMNRWSAIGTCALLWYFSIVPLTVLGSKSYGTLTLVALISYWIMTKKNKLVRTPFSMPAEHMDERVGQFSLLCRRLCSALLAAPLLYWWSFANEGDPIILLVLYLLSLIAGLLLLGNSIFCLFRYRNRGQLATSSLFLLLSMGGVIAIPYVLPGWKM